MAQETKTEKKIEIDDETVNGDIECVEAFNKGVKAPNRFGSRAILQPRRGKHVLVDPPLVGSGIFVCAEVSKRGGTTDKTFVVIEIDKEERDEPNEPIVYYAFRRGIVQGLTEHNSYGISVFQSEDDENVKTMTIGFQVPLHFAVSFRMYALVEEDCVEKIISNVIYANFVSSNGGEEQPDDGHVIP